MLWLMEPGKSQKSNGYTVGLDNWDFGDWKCELQLKIYKTCKQADTGARIGRNLLDSLEARGYFEISCKVCLIF